MTKFNKEKWTEEKAKLEREKLEVLEIISDYEGNFRPFRKVTETDYQAAKTRLWQIASELSEGNHEYNKPHNPLDDMTESEIQSAYDALKAELMANDPKQGKLAQSFDRDKLVKFNAMGNRLHELRQEQSE